MLIECPECNLQVSDKAQMCPHCGYPMKPEISFKQRRSHRRKRLPNGFGQISEIKGKNLRKPFRAMVTIGKTSEGRPICKLLKPEGYFLTYNDAYAALVEYNRKPYTLENSITMQELFNRWIEVYKKDAATVSIVNRTYSAWEYCASVYDIQVVDLRTRHVKYCVQESTKISSDGEVIKANPHMQYKIKSVFNLMLDYAMEYELVDRNVARAFNLPKEVFKGMETKNSHVEYTDDEIESLWNADRDVIEDMMLIQCYSGWRPRELCELLIENVNLDEKYMIGGSKTDAGRNRKVPIHPKIYELIESHYDEAIECGSKYLFNQFYKGSWRNLTFDIFRYYYKISLNRLGMNSSHRPHDGRVTFVTNAKKCGVDDWAIKYIIGHVINDITESIYTKRKFDWLETEIEKLR